MEQDINHIKLSARMIAGLYKDQLVEEQTQIVPVDSNKKENGKLKFLGENKKNILVLTDYNDVVYLPDEHLAFLTTILNACKISLGDVALINIAHIATDYGDLKSQLKQQKALLFNVDPSQIQLPVSFPHFQVQSFDGCQYLLSPPLENLENDKGLKGKLWTCLQRLFLS